VRVFLLQRKRQCGVMPFVSSYYNGNDNVEHCRLRLSATKETTILSNAVFPNNDREGCGGLACHLSSTACLCQASFHALALPSGKKANTYIQLYVLLVLYIYIFIYIHTYYNYKYKWIYMYKCMMYVCVGGLHLNWIIQCMVVPTQPFMVLSNRHP
jgi:hypothetical protein